MKWKSIISNCLMASLVTAAFGAALSDYFPDLSFGDGALQMLLMAGTGWIVLFCMARLRLDDWQTYWFQLSRIMLVGVCLLLPFTIGQMLWGPLPYWVPLLSVGLSSLTMIYLHMISVRLLEIAWIWTGAWFVALQSTAAFWVYFFHLR
ncbi:MAG: hypothetical protein AAFQ68_16480 [Bacteroidota bacterium]